jgi:protease-4
MKNFFWRAFGASALATLIVGIALIFLFIALLTATISNAFEGFSDFKQKPLEVKENSILHMRLRGEVADRNGILMLQGESLPLGSQSLYDMTEALRHAADDDRIEGILLEVDVVTGGLANLRDLRNELLAFRKSGKFIVAYSNAMSQSAYYLASAADEVMLYPYGYLQMNGLVARVTFLTDMFAKLEIEPQIIRGSNNRFKSAVEPLFMDHMSDANREQSLQFITTMWQVMRSEIAAGRNMEVAGLNVIVDSLPYMLGDEALRSGLLDATITRTELMDMLAEKAGGEDKPELVSFYRYCRLARTERQEQEDAFQRRVAVVYANGEIGMSDGGRNDIGTQNLPKALEEARLNPMVAAVVLRVNSPGGAVLTSDIILRELELLRLEKPVVVSMGNVAASGGYYISLPAEKIFASPLTITGSIGVFGVWPNMQGFFNNKLGITFDHVSTNKQGDFGSTTRPLTEAERARMQQEIDKVYTDFTTLVDKHRKPFASPAEVDSIGQGRVWSGVDALRLGLVDEHGSLYDAIDYAAEKAGISSAYITEYPRYQLEGLEALMAMLENLDQGDEGSDAGISQSQQKAKLVHDVFSELDYIASLATMKGIQARMVWNISFE